MKRYSREEIMDHLQQRIKNREPIIACGAGTGLYARAAERENADFILAGARTGLAQAWV